MPYYCTVPRCTSLAGKTLNVSFHQFPRDTALADRWNEILRRGKPYTKYSKVCSLHFTANDYTITTVGKNKGQWRTLRKDAIPSQNLPEHSPPPENHRHAENDENNVAEQQLHKQLAQAVYMQTIIAVHAASIAAAKSSTQAYSEHTSYSSSSDSEQNGQNATESSEITDEKQSASETSENSTDQPESDQTNRCPTAQKLDSETVHRCDQCSKCFKDPDVFLLHKRWHLTQSSAHESQEIVNKMLQLSSEFDFRFLTNPLGLDPLNMEHQILLAMRMNMESYIKNLTSFNAQKTESNEIESNE